MKNAFYIPGDVFDGFLTGGAMNAQDGACVFAVADPSIAELIPPPLKLTDPDHPLLYIYLVNIREPNFAPWYIEGGIAVMVRYGDLEGSYFFNLQLSGPGALMGALSGRDSVGLPKKLSEEMVVWREGNLGHCYIQRKGVRLLDIKLEIGSYNDPNFSLSIENCQDVAGGVEDPGRCFLHRYRLDCAAGLPEVELITYECPTRYYSWEPASAKLELTSSIDDPYGDIKIASVLGAGWMKSDSTMINLETLYTYPLEQGTDIMRYLFAGRYDASLLSDVSQYYTSALAK